MKHEHRRERSSGGTTVEKHGDGQVPEEGGRKKEEGESQF